MESKLFKMDSKGESSPWSEKYGGRHNWRRIDDFPKGISAPRKVRIYCRSDHHVLNWWDPSRKKNVSLRVDGDLLDAIMRARQIDDRIINYRRSGVSAGRITHVELVDRFIEHQRRRAMAGEITDDTCERYRTALAHYLTYVREAAIPDVDTVNKVDKDFALQFEGFLQQAKVSPNGHANTMKRPLRSTDYVISIVRAMFRWACDPNGGAILGDGFANPFASVKRRTERVARDLFGEPDITMTMAEAFLRECDAYQLPMFSLLVFYGLRPSELTLAVRESLTLDWVSIVCHPELAYFTKGRRDKKLPLLPQIEALLRDDNQHQTGLLFHNRRVHEGRVTPRLLTADMTKLIAEYKALRTDNSVLKSRAQTLLLRRAGGITYDHIEHEFKKIARKVDWPGTATLKDFRHLFNTEMQNAGMPEFYRRYLLGQSPGRSALVNYTHLNDLRQQYGSAIEKKFKPLLAAIER